MSKFKIAAALFTIFIIWVIFTADVGAFPPIIRYVYYYPGGDKAGHFILYGILAFLLALAFRQRTGWKWLPLARVTIILLILVALEEYSQSFFPSRTASLLDLIFSFLGIALGDFLAGRVRKT